MIRIEVPPEHVAWLREVLAEVADTYDGLAVDQIEHGGNDGEKEWAIADGARAARETLFVPYGEMAFLAGEPWLLLEGLGGEINAQDFLGIGYSGSGADVGIERRAACKAAIRGIETAMGATA